MHRASPVSQSHPVPPSPTMSMDACMVVYFVWSMMDYIELSFDHALILFPNDILEISEQMCGVMSYKSLLQKQTIDLCRKRMQGYFPDVESRTGMHT